MFEGGAGAGEGNVLASHNYTLITEPPNIPSTTAKKIVFILMHYYNKVKWWGNNERTKYPNPTPPQRKEIVIAITAATTWNGKPNKQNNKNYFSTHFGWDLHVVKLVQKNQKNNNQMLINVGQNMAQT